MNIDNTVSRFLKYIKIPSPSFKEGDFAETLINDLKSLGFKIFTDDSGDKVNSNTSNIIGYLKGNKDVEPILLCSHMDTVTPCYGIEPVIENGIIKSSGNTILSADDKAGIVAIIEGIKFIIENNIPHGDIEVLFTICEEVGLLGSKNLDYNKIKSKKAFVFDSSGNVGTVIVQGPAQTKIKAHFIGKAAHAGLSPEKGISAIQMASRAINNMNLLRIDEETTANVGSINGGSATNIVADTCNITLECRSLNEDKINAQIEHMVRTLEESTSHFSGKVEIDVAHMYPTFNISSDNKILNIIKTAMEKLNLDYEPRSTGGGSDSNILNSNGIDAITLGIGLFNAHSINEYISIEDLLKTTELVSSIIQTI